MNQVDLASLYEAAYAVVSPSVSDGTPNSLIEAMAVGALPLAADIEPVRDLFGSRYPELLFFADSSHSQSEAIERVLQMSRRDWLVTSGEMQKVASLGWSRNATLDRVRDWYVHVVSSHPGS